MHLFKYVWLNLFSFSFSFIICESKFYIWNVHNTWQCHCIVYEILICAPFTFHTLSRANALHDLFRSVKLVLVHYIYLISLLLLLLLFLCLVFWTLIWRQCFAFAAKQCEIVFGQIERKYCQRKITNKINLKWKFFPFGFFFWLREPAM